MGVGLGTTTAQAQTRAYVANFGSNTVSVIDTATNTVVATITVGPQPLGIAITPAPQAPTSKEQCKHGGYLKFGPPAGPFKNQGQCISYVEHH
jgi:YVTN family beta-propeller protein